MATSQAVKNKRAGSAWETALLKGLREEGYEVERLRLTGRNDEGDLAIRHGEDDWTVIEAKAGKFLPASFISQIEVEKVNFAKSRKLDDLDVDGIVVVKRRGEPWAKSYVLTTLGEYLGFAHE